MRWSETLRFAVGEIGCMQCVISVAGELIVVTGYPEDIEKAELTLRQQ